MGIHEREPMPSGHTPVAQAITKPGEAGATTDKNARDEAVIKLADSFGELARETAETLRYVRNHPDIRYYELRRWRKSIRTMLVESGSASLNRYHEEMTIPEAAKIIGTFLNGDEDPDTKLTDALPRWWWEVKEGCYDELTDELRGTVDG